MNIDELDWRIRKKMFTQYLTASFDELTIDIYIPSKVQALVKSIFVVKGKMGTKNFNSLTVKLYYKINPALARSENDLYIQNIGIDGKSKEVNGIILYVWNKD